MRLVLDTSAYSGLMRGHPDIKRFVQEADTISLNPIILGELRAGFARGRRKERNDNILRKFLTSPRVQVVSMDEETAERYAVIINSLWAAGKPIPTNDIWIAASAMQFGLAIVSMDAHFQHIPHVLVYHIEPE